MSKIIPNVMLELDEARKQVERLTKELDEARCMFERARAELAYARDELRDYDHAPGGDSLRAVIEAAKSAWAFERASLTGRIERLARERDESLGRHAAMKVRVLESLREQPDGSHT